MSGKVDAYAMRFNGWRGETLVLLRKAVVESSPEIAETFKWGQPVYEAHGPVCYLKANNKHVTLGFWRGREMMALDPRLDGAGVRMAHIKFFEGDTVGVAAIRKLVRAAVALNVEKGDPTRAK